MTAPFVPGVPRVVVPDPSLVVLVGPAGAGKSTLAGRAFEPTEVLSSDAYREVIAGDAADQRATRPAFARLERELTRRLERGALAVVDATSLSRGARSVLLRAARRASLPAVAIVLDLPAPVVLDRNARRARVVPEAVVVEQLARLRAVVDSGSLGMEGFATIYRVTSSRALNVLEVVRSPNRRR